MQKKVNRKFSALLFSLSIPLVTGCASINGEKLHIYTPPEPGTDKERVIFPLDPDNSNWIARTCKNGSFAYSSEDRELTPYGVVIKAIECVPRKEERGSQPQDALPSFRFRFAGDLGLFDKELIGEFEGEESRESPE